MNALKRALAAIGLSSASPETTTPGKAAERPGFAAAGRRQPLWLAYSLPFITTAATLLVVEAAARGEPVNTPVIVFVLPILLSAYAGGLVPGLLSTVLSTLATVFFVLPPTHAWSVASPADNIKWITLAAAGTLISFLVGRRARPGTEPLAQHSRPAGSLLLSAQRRVQTGFAVLLTCLIAIAAVSYPTMSRLRQDVARVEHSHQVIAALRLLISSATDAETGERGYIITGEEEYLEPYHSGLQGVNHALSEVRRLTRDNPEQQRRLDGLEPIVAERLAILKEGIERRGQGFSSALAIVPSLAGKLLQDRIRETVAEMEATEEALLAKREGIEQRAAVVAKIEIVGGSALAVLIVAVALWMIGEAFTASRRAETALEESRDQLEIRVNERTSELRTSEQRMAGIISSAMDAVIAVDEGQRIVLFNPAAEKLFGCNAAEALGHPLEQFIPQRFRTAHAEHIPLFGQSGRVHKPMSERAEICGLKADGTEFPIEASISQAPAGEKKLFTVILRDITERKRAEDETQRLMATVQEERDRLSALINSISDEVWFADAEKKFTLVNPTGLHEFGRASSNGVEVETLAKSLEVYRPDGSVRPVEEAPPLRALKGEVITEQEEIVRTPTTGDLRHRQVSAAPVRDSAGNIIGSVSVVRDVTERKRAEEILRERAALLELAHDSIMVREMDGTIRFWNRGAAEMYGYSPWEAIGRISHDLLRTVYPQPLAEIEANLMREGRWDGELRHTCRDGTLIVVASRWALQHENGRSPRVMEINNDITQRKRAEEAMRESEEHFRALAAASSEVVYRMNADWSEMRHLVGRSFIPDTVAPDQTWLDKYIHPDDQSRVLAAIHDAIRSKSIFELEHRVLRIDGSLGWTFSRAIPLLDANGEIVEWFGAAADITERERAEEALRESEAQFRTLANAIPQLCWMANADGWIFWYNERWYQYTGTTAEQMEGWGWQSVHEPETLPGVLERWKGSIATGEPFDMVFPLRGADGVFRPFLTRIVPVRDAEGKVARWFGTNTDISEQRRIEEDLRDSEAILQSFFDSPGLMRGMVEFVGGQIVHISCNDTAAQMYGIKRDSIAGKTVTDTGASDELTRLWATLYEEARSTGKAVSHEYLRLDAQGRQKWHLTTVSYLGVGRSGNSRFAYTTVDLTDRKHAEEALLMFVQQAPVAVAMLDGSMRYLVVSRRWLTDYDLGELEVVGRSHYEVIPEIPERWKEVHRRCLAGAVESCEEDTFPRPDGTTDWLRWEVQPWRKADDTIGGIIIFSERITERKRAEEALGQRAQELARSNADLAQFAYVASHDLKEPLRAVSGCVGLLKGHYEGKLDERAGMYMAHIVDGAARMETLIDGLLAFSRVGTQGGDLQPVECAKALGTALQNLAASIEESGAVVTHDTLPAVNGDLPQLVSLFQNLIGNALKFRREAPPRIHVSAERRGKCWDFSVRDNGIGIAPQYFERIFAVFQRLHTRREYPGTGIGLALCKKIVERHGGRIWVESVPGEGATFCFSLLEAQTNHRQHGGEFHA